jgi:hypothetical protein
MLLYSQGFPKTRGVGKWKPSILCGFEGKENRILGVFFVEKENEVFLGESKIGNFLFFLVSFYFGEGPEMKGRKEAAHGKLDVLEH